MSSIEEFALSGRCAAGLSPAAGASAGPAIVAPNETWFYFNQSSGDFKTDFSKEKSQAADATWLKQY
ncbi:hypothetical protein [Azoarcus sp. KH32C]|uniref:hypothetical protein n=1 Tax=Azoarcus sp. KH32C TaxID=748247 RepID=UPI0012EA5C3E|nr:hypothetical protein [Azoarcus sp. KH32C]